MGLHTRTEETVARCRSLGQVHEVAEAFLHLRAPIGGIQRMDAEAAVDAVLRQKLRNSVERSGAATNVPVDVR